MATTFSPEQLTGLNAANTRLGQGSATPEDIKNLNFAKSQGFSPNAGVSANPPVIPPSEVLPPTPLLNQTAPDQPIPPGPLEERPGVFKASSLTDFYNKQLQLMQPGFEAAQTQLGQLATQPGLGETFQAQRTAQIAPIEEQMTGLNQQIGTLDASLRSIEDDVRAQLGGRAAESIVQAEVSRRAQPLVKQRQALTDQFNALNQQRGQALEGIQTQLGFREADIARQTQLAQGTVDAFRTLAEKGASATAEDARRAEDMFLGFIQDNPNFASQLTEEEFSQLQAGSMPFSVLEKMSTAASVEPVKLGAGDILVDPRTGKTIAGAPKAPLTQSQLLNAAANLMAANPLLYPDLQTALQAVQSFGAGTPTETPTPDGSPGFSGQPGMRTDRHNNPTAMTTDVAKTGGLVEGVDYTVGDPFTSGGKTYYTARLIGDPMEKTIKAIDNMGFYTQGGAQRWDYIGMSKSQWDSLNDSQKREVIVGMYQREGGSGELVQPKIRAIDALGLTGSGLSVEQEAAMPTGASGQITSMPSEFKLPKPTNEYERVAQDVFYGLADYDSSVKGQKYQVNIDKLLSEYRAKALENGDTVGFMRASVGGKAPDQSFRESFEKAVNVIGQLGDLRTNIDNEATGPIIGVIRSSNPYDVKAKQIEAQLTAIVPNLARGVYGEVGVLTDQDVALYKKTLPNLNSPEAVREVILGATMRSVQRALETKIRTAAGSKMDVSGLIGLYEQVKSQADTLNSNLGGTNNVDVSTLNFKI